MERYLIKKARISDGSGLFEIMDKAMEKELSGQKVVHMEVGRPDFNTPKRITEAAKSALDQGLIYYTPSAGLLELRKAITDYTEKHLGLSYDENSEIIITIGASEGLDLIWKLFLEEEEEVLIPSPYYGPYLRQLDFSNKKFSTFETLNSDGSISYDLEKLEQAIHQNTKMILINSPNNPTGYVMSKQDMENIATLALKHDLIVVTDDCYDHFVFEGEYIHIARFPGMKERTIIVNSTSKTFAMTGWRVGYLMANASWIKALKKLHGSTVICAPSFAQAGATCAYSHEIPELEIMKSEFKRRRDYLVDSFEKIEAISYIPPKGAFYIFFHVAKLGVSGSEFCNLMMDNYGVALSPGNNFGKTYEGYVRMSYACSMEDIIYAMDHLKELVHLLEKEEK